MPVADSALDSREVVDIMGVTQLTNIGYQIGYCPIFVFIHCRLYNECPDRGLSPSGAMAVYDISRSQPPLLQDSQYREA